jgi:hypothetical protein
LNQQQQPPTHSLAAFTVRFIIAIALFALVSTPALFLGLIVSYVVVPLNLSPRVLNVFVGAKYAVIFLGVIILICFISRLMLAARKTSSILAREFALLSVEALSAIWDFFHPVLWVWDKFHQFIIQISKTSDLRMTRLHRIALVLIAITGVAIAASVGQADRYAVLSDPNGLRISQVIGPDGAVINMADDTMVTIPKWWYGEPVQLTMSNGSARTVEFRDDRVSTVLARVQ